MPLVYFVFEKEIAKFFATKQLTRGFDHDEEGNED